MNINTRPLFGRLFGLIAVLLLLQISQHVNSAQKVTTEPSLTPEDMKPIEPPWQDMYAESTETMAEESTTSTEEPTTTPPEPTTTTPEPTTTTPEPTTTTPEPTTTTPEPTTTTPEPTTTTPEPTTTTPEPTTTTPEPTTTTPEPTTTTPEPTTTPPDFQPKNIHLEDRSYKSITIAWESDESNTSPAYSVTCQRQDSDDADCVCQPSPTTENKATCKVPEQDSGQLMNITVIPEQQPGAPCDDCSISVVSVPAPPANLNAEAVNNTAVSVTWDAPEKGMTHFSYNVAVVGGDPQNTTETSLTVSGLTASKLHNITVLTYSTYIPLDDTAKGEVNWTTSWTYAKPVEALDVEPTDTSLTVSWDQRDNDGLKGYVILVMDMDDSEKCILEAHLHNGNDFQNEHGCERVDGKEITAADRHQYTAELVQACSNYQVTVYVKNEAGNSDNKTTNATTLVAEPRDQVKNVELMPYQKHINVTWDEATGPDRCPIVQYLIVYTYTDCDSADGSVLTQNKTVGGNKLTTDLTGLQPYWNYTVVVSARTVVTGSLGNSSSGPSERRTLIDEPKVPTSLNVANGEDKTVVLTWDEPELCDRNGPISAYNVSYACQNLAVNAGPKSEEKTEVVDIKKHEFSIGSYRRCTFSVAAINVDEKKVDLQGPAATEIHYTPEGAPSQVRNVRDKNTGPTWVELTWDLPSEPNGVINNYNISYTPLRFADGNGYPDASANSIITSNNETTFNVSGLHEFTTYAFTVFGTTNGGDGNMSDARNADTKVGGPLPVAVIDIEKWKDKFKVTWTQPRRTGPTDYYIQAKSLDGNNMTNKSDIIKGYNNTEGEVTGLSPYTNYTVTVVTVMVTGEASTDGQIEQTNEAVPEAVENASLNSTNSSISVSWKPPSTPNGVITQYTVAYKAISYADDIPLPNDGSEKQENTTNLLVILTELSPFTKYEVKISGWTSVGNGESTSNNKSTKYGDPTPVRHVKTEPTATLLKVTWTPPEVRTGNTSYLIHAEDLTFSDYVEPVTVYRYNTTEATLNVRPARNYSVSVQTIISTENDNLPLVVVRAENVTTLEDRPGAEPSPTIKELGDDENNCTARELKWSALEKKQRNGVIVDYSVTLKTISGMDLSSWTIRAQPDTEEKGGTYTHTLPVAAGSTYNVTVSANTKIGSGPEGSKDFRNRFCAPPFPEGESQEEPTQTVKSAANVEKLPNQILVELSNSYFNNADGGPIRYSGLVVAEASEAESDPDKTGMVLQLKEFQEKYGYWSTAKQQENMPPFKINITDVFVKRKWKRSVQSQNEDVERFTVGENTECGNSDVSCNGPLNAAKSYKFRGVSCTDGGCTMTSYSVAVETAPPPSNAGAIAAGVIVPILIIGIVCGILFFMYRQDLGPFAGKTMRAAPYHHDSGHDNPGIRMDDVPPNPVPLPEFPDHVAKRHQNSDLLFAEEYKLLKELSPRMTWNAAELPYNRNKNRYNNILPYDHSRVKLLAVDDEDEAGSDYINANFMPGYNSKREFIANQGPLASTKDDFWRLVWEHNVPIIVMVTKCVEKGRQKCEQYWPNDNEPVYYGDLQVQVRSESVLNNYTIRIIDISMGSEKRTVKHMHVLAWPDHGCPTSTDLVLQFTLAVRHHMPRHQRTGPVAVHCSAGVGRTGTFVCVDRLLQQMRDHDTVDVFGTILEMRRYRTNMVQTEDQYIYIHDCLRDALSQGLHKQYPTNNPQPPPDLRPPQTTEGDDDQPLYVNVEISAPQAQIVSEKRISNGNSTGL